MGLKNPDDVGLLMLNIFKFCIKNLISDIELKRTKFQLKKKNPKTFYFKKLFLPCF